MKGVLAVPWLVSGQCAVLLFSLNPALACHCSLLSPTPWKHAVGSVFKLIPAGDVSRRSCQNREGAGKSLNF